jgi:hypothetical protein
MIVQLRLHRTAHFHNFTISILSPSCSYDACIAVGAHIPRCEARIHLITSTFHEHIARFHGRRDERSSNWCESWIISLSFRKLCACTRDDRVKCHIWKSRARSMLACGEFGLDHLPSVPDAHVSSIALLPRK